jgi:L-seryl-tRNA(Ser) seleniumtransferase
MPASRPPSVDALTRRLLSHPAIGHLPRTMLVDAARRAIAAHPDNVDDEAVALARVDARRLLTPVINATGTLLHTNLGRAPRRPCAPSSVTAPVRGLNIELDLGTGLRGSRHDAVRDLLTRLTGAEASLVVNNCAAGLVLVLAALARGRGVVVSRGELVEIGGGFRIPDIIEQSGCTLIEVGTTNRTRLADFTKAIADHDVAVVLKVHPSNYRITGFTEEVGIAELSTLGVPVVADLGTGLLDATTPWLADRSGAQPDVGWIRSEPSVKAWLAAGADIVIVSGDKLLGGPQAGLVVGASEVISVCATHPLLRALRPGSLILEALQETLLTYLHGAATSLPFWEQALRPVGALVTRAESIVHLVDHPRASASPCVSTPGGGTMPDTEIASFGIRVDGSWTDDLRDWTTPIVARSAASSTWLDLRTVDPADDAEIATALRSLLHGTHAR